MEVKLKPVKLKLGSEKWKPSGAATAADSLQSQIHYSDRVNITGQLD